MATFVPFPSSAAPLPTTHALGLGSGPAHASEVLFGTSNLFPAYSYTIHSKRAVNAANTSPPPNSPALTTGPRVTPLESASLEHMAPFPATLLYLPPAWVGYCSHLPRRPHRPSPTTASATSIYTHRVQPCRAPFFRPFYFVAPITTAGRTAATNPYPRLFFASRQLG